MGSPTTPLHATHGGLARVGEIELAWEAFGDSKAPPVLLIMGLGAQMLYWCESFCAGLAERGFRVIRFDNRDIGKSSRIDIRPQVPLTRAMLRRLLGLPVPAPYNLSDMAADAAGLLDALGIARAHVVGASMGGMIAQTLAIEYPERVRSLSSLMSTPGDRRFMLARPSALQTLWNKRPRGRQAIIDQKVATLGTLAGEWGFEEARVRALVTRCYERGHNPRGYLRQLLAVLASGSRRKRLRRLRVPTLVVHGAADPLIPSAAGRATARLIRGARLKIIKKMGHEMPPRVWPTLIDAIAAVAAQALAPQS